MKSSTLTLVVATCLTILTGSTVLADTGTGWVTGCIRDANTDDPVVGAWVVIAETNIGNRTDSLGCFTIENVTVGKHTLIITHPMYGTIRSGSDLEVTVMAGKKAAVAIEIGQIKEEIRNQTAEADFKEKAVVADRLGITSTIIQNNEMGVSIDLSSHEKKSPAISIPAPVSGATYRDKIVRTPTCPPYPRQEFEEIEYPWPPDAMYFQDYGTNRFVDVRRDPFSTFATDVDDASYNVAKEYLLDGLMPPRDAIRVEEFLNHFDYGYNPPTNSKFRVFTELTDSPFESGISYLKIGIKGREISRSERKPLNLTFVVDVSGSMSRDNRMGLVRDALRMLVGQLDAHDQLGIVAYGSNAYVILEPTRADRVNVIERAINGLKAGGSTYAEAGLRLGYDMANRQYVNGHNNVMVLCSDGVANVGQTSPDAIMADIERYSNKGITLSTFGFGMGNYNDVLLEQLAQKGNGRYAYINNRDEARETFVEDFVGNMELLARDVKLQVEFNSNTVRAYRLLGYENRDVADHRFRDDTQDGGEVGAGHEVTALYELQLSGKHQKGELATVFVRWKNSDDTEVSEESFPVSGNKTQWSFDRSRPELRLAIVASRFGEILKGTPYASSTSLPKLASIAEDICRELPSEQTRELVELIQRTQQLSGYQISRQDKSWDEDENYRR